MKQQLFGGLLLTAITFSACSDDFSSEETAIKRIETSLQDGTYYNLTGQPVPHPTKGLYILNGRKVMRR